MEYEAAMAALEKAEPHLNEDEIEALSEMVALFKPYEGDDPDEAKARDHAKGHCANCGYEAPLMFFPALLDKAATTALRLSKCPRCFSTRMMCGPAARST
jgi:hypothetical protein